MSEIDDTRIVVSTIKNGRVGFGQVIMEQQKAPKQIILVALDSEFGLIYWECSHRKLKSHTVPQHSGYSRCLPAFTVDEEPTFLGGGYELPMVEIANWPEIMNARTRAKNALVREIFA